MIPFDSALLGEKIAIQCSMGDVQQKKLFNLSQTQFLFNKIKNMWIVDTKADSQPVKNC